MLARTLTFAVFLCLVSWPKSPCCFADSHDTQFTRGDIDGDTKLQISDAFQLLTYLFQGHGTQLDCPDAADLDDDGSLDIADVLVLSSYLFTGGRPPASPFPGCGIDPTLDDLDCKSYGPCADTIGVGNGEPSGLDARPLSTGCGAFPRPTLDVNLAVERVFPNLSLVGLLDLRQKPGDSSKWYAVRKGGYIYRWENNDNVTTKTTVATLTDRVYITDEGGLLGMAFHPNFASNGYVYLGYTRQGTTTPVVFYISRFVSRDGGATIDTSSETVLLTVNKPSLFHFGGCLVFGPDGYLYAGSGDSGNAANAGDWNSIAGGILRLDVNSGSPYGIPPDNPRASGGGRPELFVKGLRNPWRFSFDRLTGDIWCGDVGKDTWEEIDRIRIGENLGWPVREGAHCYNATTCNTAGLVDPVHDYGRTEGTCVIGGYVYRGSRVPSLNGVYLYGDWGNGRIWGLTVDGGGHANNTLLVESGLRILSFAEGLDGEVYVLSNDKIHRFIATQGGPAVNFPQTLSATGYFRTNDPTKPKDCFLPYDINVPFWSDGATKERWFSIPDGTSIHINADGDWEFPIGTVFIKSFRVGGSIIETRLLMRHDDGDWAGYSYEWNDAQTDATLLDGAKNKVVGTTTWTYPDRGQCLQCHTSAAGRTLGPQTSQMNRTYTYPQTGRTANQLPTYDFIGLFDAPLGTTSTNLPVLPSPSDASKPLLDRAKSYFHSNCSHCHQPNGGGRGSADFRYSTPESGMGICDALPTAGDLGVAGARLLVPGDVSRSLISIRMRANDTTRMPPIGRNHLDAAGAALIDQWIASVASCPAPPQGTEVILDNGQPGTSKVGTWLVSGGPNPYGANSVYSKTAGTSFTYQLALPQSGQYDVYLWWTQWSSRLGNVPVVINHSGGSQTVTVDQRVSGGQWNRLGAWNFGPSATVTIQSPGGGTSCADAVKLAAAPAVGPVVLDNGQTGTSSIGTWLTSGGPNPYGASSIYSKVAGAKYTYQVGLPQPGSYEVQLWWTQWPSRLTAIPIDIVHNSGTATVNVNQQTNGGKWNTVGTWAFGGNATIVIRSLGPGTTCADAVRLVPAAE